MLAQLKMGCLLNTPGVGFDSVANAIDQCQYQCWWCLIERPSCKLKQEVQRHTQLFILNVYVRVLVLRPTGVPSYHNLGLSMLPPCCIGHHRHLLLGIVNSVADAIDQCG